MEQGNRNSGLLFSTETVFGPVYSFILQDKLVNVENVLHFYLRVSAEISPFVFVKDDPILCTSFVELFPQPCFCLAS